MAGVGPQRKVVRQAVSRFRGAADAEDLEWPRPRRLPSATMLHMERIGVRELRQNASRYLARVESGETIEVTDRGRPVARLTPIVGAGWDQLVAEGRLRVADRSLAGLGDPIPLPEGADRPSEILQRMREE